MSQRTAGSMKFILRLALPACCLLCFLTACGGSPSAVNIQLRKENQKISAERDQLAQQHAADAETIQSLESKNSIPPAVAKDRLDKLFTAQNLSIGRLTAGHQPAGSVYDDGITVYVVPTDDQSEPIKAAGSFKIEAFDLQTPEHPLIGTWTFDTNQTRSLFYAHLSLYTYVLQCPWQTTPRHHQLTLHVTFTDELTGRVLAAQQIVNVNPARS